MGPRPSFFPLQTGEGGVGGIGGVGGVGRHLTTISEQSQLLSPEKLLAIQHAQHQQKLSCRSSGDLDEDPSGEEGAEQEAEGEAPVGMTGAVKASVTAPRLLTLLMSTPSLCFDTMTCPTVLSLVLLRPPRLTCMSNAIAVDRLNCKVASLY